MTHGLWRPFKYTGVINRLCAESFLSYSVALLSSFFLCCGAFTNFISGSSIRSKTLPSVKASHNNWRRSFFELNAWISFNEEIQLPDHFLQRLARLLRNFSQFSPAGSILRSATEGSRFVPTFFHDFFVKKFEKPRLSWHPRNLFSRADFCL